jgi:hypothetical protein
MSAHFPSVVHVLRYKFVYEMLILGKRVAAILLKSEVPILYSETSNFKNRSFSRVELKELDLRLGLRYR